MPVSNTHPDYDSQLPLWQRCRDVYEGSDTIKAQGAKYLPMLGGQEEKEYLAYKERALFYNAMGRTVEGLGGFVFRKAPEIVVSDEVKEDLKDITMTGVPFLSFCRGALHEVLITGRYGVLVDMAPAEEDPERPYLVAYRAEQIINWRTTRRGGDTVLALVVLSETSEETDPEDSFHVEIIHQYRVLSLDAAGFYQMDIWRQVGKESGYTIVDSFLPQRFGQRLDFIPFEFLGPHSESLDLSKPPLLDLVDVNLSHYRSSADLEHARHYTALPTPWVAGFPEDTELKIGSTVAWVSTNPEARVGMLEFTGQGLGALEKALSDKEGKMAALGARLLESRGNFSESEEAIKLRQAGEESFLQTLAGTLSSGLTKILTWYSEWRGSEAEVSVALNKDYISAGVSAELLRELTATWQAGGISWPTYYQALQNAEIARQGVSADEEKELIAAEMPSVLRPPEIEDAA